MCMSDEEEPNESPLINIEIPRNPDTGVLFSPLNTDPNSVKADEQARKFQSSGSFMQSSARESDSEGNSMGVLYQSSMGSMNQDNRGHSKNGRSSAL
mgnify:CR=1 FL=1